MEFVVLDVETTGLEPSLGDRIVEIGAIRLRNSRKLDQFQALVNPQRPISPGAFWVNRITPQMLKGAPKIDEILPNFLEFICGSCLCGYNVGFDISFLNNELTLLGRPLIDMPIIDIYSMAKRLLPHLCSYSLFSVAENLKIKTAQLHRALNDVQFTAEVFKNLLKMLKQKGIEDFNQLHSLFGLRTNLLNEANQQKLNSILKAVDLGTRLKIKYLSAGNLEVTEREVTPKEIRHQGKWDYLVGFCHLRNQERTFKLNAILQLEMVEV